jgi:prefoldin subunit 5
LKKKLLSPLELKKFRAEQLEARRIRSEQLKKESKKLSGPKELLDPKPVIEVVEEPVVKEPIELLQERVDEFSNQYNEELAQLEVRLANKLELDDVNLQPIQNNIKRLRESISELPEVKYYDDDLDKLTERVDQLQVSGSEIFQQHGDNLKEIKKVTHQMLKDLDNLSKREIPEAFDPTDIQTDITATKETFYERVAELKKELSELPEVKYYDDELTQLQERIESVRDSIPEVPEIKYYDEDLENLLTLIAEVRGSIPEMPEVRYYEDEITQLEESIKSVEDRIPTVPEVRYYEDDIEALREEIKNVEGKIPEVPEIPEIKYYDEEVEILSEDIDKVRDSIIDIKLAIRAVEKSVEVVEGREIPEAFDPTGLQIEIEKAFKEIEKLKEQPVTVKEDADPLTPLEDKFVTFDELSKHYRTFITRIQQQLASLGGGGEVNLRYLDDIDRSSISDGKVLSYDAATNKFKFISPGAASSLWNEDGADIYRNSNVGINSADPQVALDVVGDVNVTGVITATSFTGDVTGTLTGEFVSNLDKTLEYQSGTLSTITTAQGTKTLFYDGAGILTSIIGTGVYVSKTFSYDGNGNLISVNVL